MNPTRNTPATQDTAELEALFDAIAGQVAQPAASPGAAPEPARDGQDRAFNRVGQMMRQLTDTLRELGYDKLIQDTVRHAIPDTRDRLAYIANLSEQAACRVLNATDIALPLQEALNADARALGGRWHDLYGNRLSVAEFKALADDTVAFLDRQVPARTDTTSAQLMEIMMAQDFQDLTGQVIKRIVGLAQGLEAQLMAVLVDLIPEERRSAEAGGLLNGPVIRADAGSDAVVSQRQVDDLLDSLGF